MNGLYLAPVSENWKKMFEQTVETPISLCEYDLPEDLKSVNETRIWGTTTGGNKGSYFEQMESGDIVLFYQEGEYFAAGRVGETYQGQEVGREIWNNPNSEYVYTVRDYTEISVSSRDVAEMLGYKSSFIPNGFMRVSESAVSNLLQQYNSVEEAFQDIRETYGTDTDDEEAEHEDEEKEDDQEVRTHTKVQAYLVELGQKHGYDVYVAKNDRNREYNGRRLGDDCVDGLNLTGFSESALNIIEYVDVIWLEDDYIVKMFEVESTTSIYSGILRMTDFVVKVPNFAVEMYIVAPDSDEDKVRKEMNRPTFQKVLGDAEHCSLNYLSFDEVKERHETVSKAGPLRKVF
jgi:hypothetical protein